MKCSPVECGVKALHLGAEAHLPLHAVGHREVPGRASAALPRLVEGTVEQTGLLRVELEAGRHVGVGLVEEAALPHREVQVPELRGGHRLGRRDLDQVDLAGQDVKAVDAHVEEVVLLVHAQLEKKSR